MKKTLRILIILLIYLFLSNSYSQKLNKIYYGITSDSLSLQHYLEFKNDSIIELTSIPRHMQNQFKMLLRYENENGKIIINNGEIELNDLKKLSQYGFSQFSNKIELNQNDRALLDRKNRVIYVILDDFKKDNYITYIINGIEYQQKNVLTDSYGLVKNDPKTNRKLRNKLKEIEPELENYQIEVYKGIDAFIKFGYDKVLGVIELEHK